MKAISKGMNIFIPFVQSTRIQCMDTLNEIVEFKTSLPIRRKLASYSIVKIFQAGEVIQRENAYIKAIPIVSYGRIKVVRTDDEGREIFLYYIKAGESCIMSFLGGMYNETAKVKAIAEEETEIYFIPVNHIVPLIKEFPEWLEYIFRLYHKRFEELLEVVNALAFKKVDDRLLSLLKIKCEMEGKLTISVTHAQLASELGTARVVVSRLLKQMEDAGLVTLGRNKITLIEGN
jgi:cAMP-binding proteins - catabolite gene activator and regulatory subunit of cAMP-dependent protein kinases